MEVDQMVIKGSRLKQITAEIALHMPGALYHSLSDSQLRDFNFAQLCLLLLTLGLRVVVLSRGESDPVVWLHFCSVKILDN